MLSLGVLDKLFAVLENAELLGVEVARHLANRCALLQPEEIFNISIEIKETAIWCGPASCRVAQVSDFTPISLSGCSLSS